MANNIPGASNALPGVYSDTVTQSRGATLALGQRVPAIIGEGSTDQTLVASANGGGKDGLNTSYSSNVGADGRHFQISFIPSETGDGLVSNRTTVYKNGRALNGVEDTIDANAFSDIYDYRLDPATGKIELQRAHLVDQGGSNYVALSSNIGLGTLDSLQLVDVNAPPETWTIRCISVQRDSLNTPIQETARFIAIGSVSGAKLDANGNPVFWVADGYTVSNGVLSFAISETQIANVSTSPFREGDGFTVKVASGVLVRGDSLTVNFIPHSNINDPVILQNQNQVVSRHGSASLSNNLSLGCQLAFANNAPVVLTVQAAPAMPRRTSYVLADSVNSDSSNPEDLMFALPVGVIPDANANIHFFVTNNVTNVETQLLPNKFPYYTLGESGQPTISQFVFSNTAVPAGYSFSYTVVERYAAIVTGEDGYLAKDSVYNRAWMSASNVFNASHVGKTVRVIDAVNVANIGDFLITSVIGGKVYFESAQFADFTSETGVAFQVLNASTLLPVSGGSGTDGILTNIIASETGTVSSTAVDFSLIPSITNYKLKITGSDTNNGIYDITSYDNMTDTLTIKKTFVVETGLRYEIIDPLLTSDFIVVNKNVVPTGYSLRATIIDSRDAGFYDAGWINALESLEKVECDIVVPLPKETLSVIFQNTLSHCITMSNTKNRKERVLFCGAINGLKPENLTGAELAAVENVGILEGIQGDNITEILNGNIEDLANYSVPDSFGNTYRCVYFYPDQVVVATSENLLLDGFYIAAAAAGWECAQQRIEMPMTNKVLSGLTILRNKQYSSFTLEELSAAGVTVLQPVSGGGLVQWGITTSQSGFVEEQEISIIFIRDRVSKMMRGGFKGFVGTPETPTTQIDLTNRGIGLLNSMVGSLITQYKDLVVERDALVPTQWNVSCRVQPTYPINWIYIKIGVGLL